MTTLISQQSITGDADLRTQLHAAFLSVRAAIDADSSAILIVREADLLGQGEIEDAALAAGLVGLMRAVVFEGRSKGWRVNVISVDDLAVDQTGLVSLLDASGLTGQIMRTSTRGAGKVAL